MEDTSTGTDAVDSESVIPPEKMVGRTFHRFRCTRVLGKGAMATVLLGEDIALKRPVALKLLVKDNKANPAHRVWLEQFIREARAAAQLMHPGIVQVYDAGIHDGYLFIAMEAMLGGSLEELVRRKGPLPVARAVELAKQAAEALAFAHQHGVLHRDIKPGNILLSDQGQCKLGDFGLAVREDPTDSFQLPRNFIGTPYYLAPEVLRHKASAKSDVYALGATLWYMLTGDHPYAVREIRDVLRVGKDIPLGDLRALCPGASIELADLLARSLLPSPRGRIATAEEFLKALNNLGQASELNALARAVQSSGAAGPRARAAVAAAPVRAAAVASRPARPARRRWLPICIAAAIVTVSLAAVAGLAVLGWRLLYEPPPEPAQIVPDIDQSDSYARVPRVDPAPVEQAPPAVEKPPVEPTTKRPAVEKPAAPTTKRPAAPATAPPAKRPTAPVAAPPAKVEPPSPAPAQPGKQAAAQAADGSFVLPANLANLHGANLKLKNVANRRAITNWDAAPQNWVSWTLAVKTPGTFEITADVATGGPVNVILFVAGNPVQASLPATGGQVKFQTVKLGEAKLYSAGTVSVEIRSVAAGWKQISLANVQFKKVK